MKSLGLTIRNFFRSPVQKFKKIPLLIVRNKIVLSTGLGLLFITIIFMWPMASNISTYSDGGDHMFNAWTLSRDHHCILQQRCDNYVNGNIYFPNKDSMLYSETQISTAILTLPLYLINNNPLFAVNIWTILSVFFAAWFMYLLARYLSKGNQAVSVLTGLVFAFAPTKMTSLTHLQNLSIFYVPLIILLLLKYRDTGNKRYIILFSICSALLFLASWYQMVFGLVIIMFFIAYVAIGNRKQGLALLAATVIAIVVTLPIAKEYVRFSKANKATFSIGEQAALSASILDYFMPQESTPVGIVYYKLRPFILKNSYNPDSYSYAGISLYIILIVCLVLALRRNKKGNEMDKERRRLVIMLVLLFAAGVVFSLGPLFKIGKQYIFSVNELNLVIPLPYILVDKFLPQLSFIRAVGRASVISLFALCCLLAIFSINISRIKSARGRKWILVIVIMLVSIDLLPVKQFVEAPFQKIPSYKLGYEIPAVYKLVQSDESIDNIIILRTQKDYPGVPLPVAPIEDVLWAGYHNKNIFNGYSGFEPPKYRERLLDFIDLQKDDVAKMQSLGLKYAIVDKQLSIAQSRLESQANTIFSKKIYEDQRYVLYKI